MSVSVSAAEETPQYTTIEEVVFYIAIEGEQMDTSGNIDSRPKTYFTDAVFTTALAEKRTADDKIVLGEDVTEEQILSALQARPDDEDVFGQVIDVFKTKGYIRDNMGAVIPWAALKAGAYRAEWYVLKYEVDGWHVDGRIINRATEKPIEIIVPDDPTDIPEEATKDLEEETDPVTEVDTEPVTEPETEPVTEPETEPQTEPESEVPDYHDPYKLTNDYAYIFGRSDFLMEPEDGMKRGEAAAVLYRLLKQNKKLGGFEYDIDAEPVFSDTAGRWDRSALEYMSYIGVYGDSGKIGPDAYITRSEAFKMIAIALNFTDDTSLEESKYALILKDAAYIEGDGDGNLALERGIKRAEFCKIYNLIIGRDTKELVTKDGEEVTPGTYGFVDIPSDAWYYEDILKATSAFDGDYVDLAARAKRNVLDDYS